MQSKSALQSASDFHWRLQFKQKTTSGTLSLPTDKSVSVLFPDDLPQTLNSLDVNRDAVLFCAILGNEWDTFTEETLTSLQEGQFAVVLRYTQYNSILPLGVTARELFPDGFVPEQRIEISAEKLEKTLTDNQAKELLRLLSDVFIRDHVALGQADVADEGQPSIKLFDKQGNRLEITLSNDKLLLYDCQNGSLQRALARDPLTVRMLKASIWKNLGIEKSSGEVFQLPQTISEEALGWTLIQSVPSKDIWL